MIDQITWNILFEWITGTRCFLPEGCKPPIVGITIYLIIAAPIIYSLHIFYKTKLKPNIQIKKALK